MAGEQTNYPGSYNIDPNLRLRDLEEKQRVLKNQILLIGKNLIDIREKNTHDILEIKKDLDVIKTDIERLASFIDSASDEFSKFARKDDVEILAKQMRMFQRNPNISDQEIISELRKQFSPREINEALNHAQIKNAVSDIQGEDAPMPQEEQQYQDYGQQAQDQGGGYDQSQVYTPQPQQQAYYPQQQGYQDYGQQQGYYPQQQASNTDTIVEVSEQVFDEKISNIAKKVDSIDEFKILTQARMEHLNERLKRVESIIDRLQASILEKVGSYGSNLESIKKEMSMMQDSFSKTLGGSARRSSQEDEETQEEPEEQAEKISKKKK
jgi:hypothetical protein